MAAMEARAEEQRQARARADAGWRQQQRERELRRAEEERAREKEVHPLGSCCARACLQGSCLHHGCKASHVKQAPGCCPLLAARPILSYCQAHD